MSRRSALSADRLRKALSPQTYNSSCATDYWVQCLRAAISAVRACCGLTNAEVSYFHRANWLEDERIVRIVDMNAFFQRDVPMMDAARLVVRRYMDAMPAPFKESRYLFVSPKGKRLDVASIKQTIDQAAQRNDLSQNLWGDLGATFSKAVHSDPELDGAALVLTRKGLAAHGLDDNNRPGIERLGECLDRHPLAKYGDVSFFEVNEPSSRLYRRIRVCWEKRDLTDDQRRNLRLTEFPEAMELHDRGLITQTIMARYFGLKDKQMRHWRDHYVLKGEASLRGNRSGTMTQEWRTKIQTLCVDRPDTETRREFHAFLVEKHDFPWKLATLQTFLASIGYRSEHRYRKVSIAFGDLIESEYAELSAPPRLPSFHRQLQAKGFTYGPEALRRFMDDNGLAHMPDKHGRAWQQRVVDVARATRPKTYRELHAVMVKKGYPCWPGTMTKWLREAGIELSARAPGGRRFGRPGAAADPDKQNPCSSVATCVPAMVEEKST
ncbi:hypothetical protein AB4Z51_29130 [Bradyrhizobium sp. 2TAF36]|uniref:hypothetical protein n=1 Tax=Bradyrhizobium sp. 2TAF36 TaxID=3233016 RepID=UPI003F90C8E2